jgi:hypothetical protein
MALIGSAPALRCSFVKPIGIAVSTVLDESRCGHKASVWVWDEFHGVSCFLEKCVAVCLGYCGRGVQ